MQSSAEENVDHHHDHHDHHNHNHNHNHNHAHHHHISNATILYLILFGAGFIPTQALADMFDSKQGIEYITNSHVDSVAVQVSALVASIVANLPLLAAIIYCWVVSNVHHDEEEHEHSITQEIIEFLSIGTAFGLIGAAASLDTVNELTTTADFSTFDKVLDYSGAAVTGLFTAFGAYKLHGFHMHAAMNENGGGISGFLKGLYVTFINNVWESKNSQTNILLKMLTVFNEVWKKFGILAAHALLGIFAADVFSEQTGLGKRSPELALLLKIFLSIAVTLLEGNTEARSLDDNRKLTTQQSSFSPASQLVVIFSGFLHSIPSITALATLIGETDSVSSNLLIYLAATLMLAYPNIEGFRATAIMSFDRASKGVLKKIKCCKGDEGYKDIEAPAEAGGCSFANFKRGFWRTPEAEPQEQVSLYLKQAISASPSGGL
jgi:hypothetical protein